jgi:hypothetical protein
VRALTARQNSLVGHAARLLFATGCGHGDSHYRYFSG